MGRCRADGEGGRRVARLAPQRGHRDLYTAINRLADETGDPNLRRLFHTASSLHANFYEGWQPREMVEQGLSDVAELVETLDALEA